jgi:hypothetical protein
MTPTPGKNSSATAMVVVIELSKECSPPSVAQKHSKIGETARSRPCLPVIGPNSVKDLATVEWPPGISFASGGIIVIMI